MHMKDEHADRNKQTNRLMAPSYHMHMDDERADQKQELVRSAV